MEGPHLQRERDKRQAYREAQDRTAQARGRKIESDRKAKERGWRGRKGRTITTG